MRNSRAFVAAGTVRVNALGMRHAVVTIAVLVGALWVGIALAQEAYLGHRLSQQVSDLRRQNAIIAAQNAGYHKDIQALQWLRQAVGKAVPRERRPKPDPRGLALALNGQKGGGIIESRSGAAAARRAHNPKVVGSNPTSATN